jgi:RNA polymerase sigma-70 factor (ECF subfamily)
VDTRSESLPPRAEALLSQSDWVRALVRGLGVDESGAEDVLQSTWMAALATPPRTGSEGASMRAWIARVARNFALKRLGRDKNRAARERASAKDERLPSAADVVEREEARGQVVQALLDVPEPYRTTLLLRFYENLEPRDIARLQQVPGSTVRNRLRRGLELLRERLERELGATWAQRCALVLPLMQPRGPAIATANGPAGGSGGITNWIPANGTTGGGLVLEKVGLAAAAVLAASGLVLTWTWSSSGDDASSTSTSSLSSELAVDGATGASAPGTPSMSTELAPAEAGSSRERATNSIDPNLAVSWGAGYVLRGRLLGPDGQPLQPASSILRTRLAGFGTGSAISSEGAGPSAPKLVYSIGAARGVEVRLPKLTLSDMKLEEPGPQPPQGIDDLDAAQEPAAQPSEEKRDLVLTGDPIVQEFFLDTTFGFEDSTRLPPRIVLSNDAGEIFETSIDNEGAFRFQKLSAGSWHLFAEAAGCQSKRMEVEIAPAERDKSLDVRLEAVIHLRVKLVTPDGKDLGDAAFGDPGAAFMPVPFAIRACPNDRTRDLSLDPARRYGSGRWKDGSDFPDESLGDASGILEIYDPLPLFVGVAACGFVLESRMVTSGEDEVVFEIDPARIRELAASVSLSILSAEDGQRIEGAVASIEATPDLVMNSRGALEAAIVPPGRRKLVLEAEDYERREEWIEVIPGARMDLGTRSLGRPVEISGRIVDESGSPLDVSFEVVALDRGLPGSPLLSGGRADSDPDGTFRHLEVGPGRYLLTLAEGDSTFEPKVVDTRDGPVKDLVLVASDRTTIRVMPPFEPPPDAIFVVETANGIPVQVAPSEGWTSFEVLQGVLHGWVKLVIGSEVLWKRAVGE